MILWILAGMLLLVFPAPVIAGAIGWYCLGPVGALAGGAIGAFLALK